LLQQIYFAAERISDYKPACCRQVLIIHYDGITNYSLWSWPLVPSNVREVLYIEWGYPVGREKRLNCCLTFHTLTLQLKNC